jgi:hypothetical protein
MSTAEIQKMTNAERLQAMEALWEALCLEEKEPESPAWHEEVLADRKRTLDSGEAQFLSLDEVKKRLSS